MNKFIEVFDKMYIRENGKLKNGVYEDDYKIIIKQETGYEWIEKRDGRKVFVNGMKIERYENGNVVNLYHEGMIVKTLYNYKPHVVRDYKERNGILKMSMSDMKCVLGNMNEVNNKDEYRFGEE